MVDVTPSDDYWSPALNATDLDHHLDHTDYDGGYRHRDPGSGAGSSGAAILHPSMIVLLVVVLAALLAVMAVLLVKWQRRRYQNCPWNNGNVFSSQQVM